MSVFREFVVRAGSQLFEGERRLRIVSANVPNLHVLEDPLPHWHRVDPWEIEDAFKTFVQMGFEAVRMYVPSVSGGRRNGAGASHIYAPGNYDEILFQDMDRVLEAANRHGVRVIIPLTDHQPFFGGLEEFARLYGRAREAFFTDEEVIRGFLDFVTWLANRENVFTGQRYCEDKAILAWETGNEIFVPDDAWTARVARHLKCVAPRHLVLDGNYGIRPASLENEDVDIVSNHYYTGSLNDALQRLKTDVATVGGRRPFLVGEIGMPGEHVRAFLNHAIEQDVLGVMIWSMRFRNREGGFYYHHEGGEAPMGALVYRWPGFENGACVHEREVMSATRDAAYQIRGETAPRLPTPEAPELLPIQRPQRIGWRGSAGAEHYIIERSETAAGPWQVLTECASEADCPYRPYRDDPPAGTWHYRVKAANRSGVSPASKPVSVRVDGAPPPQRPHQRKTALAMAEAT